MIQQRKIPDWELKRRKEPQIKNYKLKQCKFCEKEFLPRNPSHLFCSDDCKAGGTAQRYYLKTYGLKLIDVQNMMKAQDYKCAICLEKGFQMNSRVYHDLNVDHCHETGTVRGLLCHNCNRALGLLKDDVNRLKRAITYIESATTISKESTVESQEAHSSPNGGDDDIVWSI